MKTVKKSLALLLALLMVTAFAATAFAATGDPMGHNYVAYQIFSGKITKGTTANDTILTDVTWGSNIKNNNVDKSSLLLTELEGNDLFHGLFYENNTQILTVDKATAADVANFLSGKANDSDVALAFARIAEKYIIGNGAPISNNEHSSLTDGYYLIVDNSNYTNTGDVKNLTLLQLAQDDFFEIREKTTVPMIEKKVQDKNDSQPLTTEPWQDSADYDFNDPVPFQVTIDVDGNMLKYFDTYSLKINDTLDPGFAQPTDLTITCNNTAITLGTGENATNHVSIVKNSGNETNITITLKDIKSLSGIKLDGPNTFVLTYNAVLTTSANIGCNATTHKGNDNKVDLEYSRNPNRPDYVLDGTSNTYIENNGGTDFGQTPPDTVRVFTYQFIVNKVDSQQHALAGAKFKLWKYDPSTVTPTNDGFTINLGEPDPTGNPANVFTWEGLDDGVYKLEETAVPAGYNSLEDVIFEVKTTHSETSDDPVVNTLTCTEVKYDTTQQKFVPVANSDFVATTSIPAGSISTDIINQSGVVLPETGADGTQMLYIFGSVLLLGALVLIVTKKRVGEQS